MTGPAGSPPSTAWSVEHHRGPAADHHGLDVPDPAHRAVWAFALDGPALVLGSTQRVDDVDAEAAAALGVEVVRRRSGGGAVLLEPDDVAWIDVIVPRGDPLWSDDVAVAAEWLGQAWVGRPRRPRRGRRRGPPRRAGLRRARVGRVLRGHRAG